MNICFHGIGTPRRELEPGESAYWITHDHYLRVLDEIASWPGVIRLSFDDGNVSDVEAALPGLAERGLAATFFVLAGRIDRPGSLTAGDLRSLVNAGMTVGSHGMDHRSWRAMDEETASRELRDARDMVGEAAGARVVEAACPLGDYDRRALHQLRTQDYTTVFTSDRRPARSGAWLQPRYSVRRDDTPERLRAEVFARKPLRRLRSSTAALVKSWR